MRWVGYGCRDAGFTLIEVLVVMVIVAVLAAIAIPNYTAFIQRGARTEAKAVLETARQWIERNRAESGSYSTTASGAAVTLPGTFQRSPEQGAARYAITLVTPNAFSFSLTAAPAGAQVGDECGSLRVDQTGARCLVDATVAATSCQGHTVTGDRFNRCWGR